MILYLHGFASGPSSKKGLELERRFRRSGQDFLRADLTPGEEGFEHSTPLTMLAEVERLIALNQPRALVGSSLGGYLAALAARHPGPVERLVLLAPAFRLFERWRARLSADEERTWRREGLPVLHSPTGRTRRLGYRFLAEAAGLPAYPAVEVPVLVFAGRRDEVVPLEDVVTFVEHTRGARLVELEDGHDLLASIDRIFAEARAFLGAAP
ncbi:MAG TPA: YqiA/YcfP family alpha/beta fold hydrolase [Anaeromyxobacteraceae bacterium]|nr:YqiA/YcfP family alpha/beta fold hydrolase [Anaeromyxobacteraceae bacterium]